MYCTGFGLSAPRSFPAVWLVGISRCLCASAFQSFAGSTGQPTRYLLRPRYLSRYLVCIIRPALRTKLSISPSLPHSASLYSSWPHAHRSLLCPLQQCDSGGLSRVPWRHGIHMCSFQCSMLSLACVLRVSTLTERPARYPRLCSPTYAAVVVFNSP